MKKVFLGILPLIFLLTGCVPSVVAPAPTDFGLDPFVFEEKEFDFGTIKQSGGLVSHDFVFTYVGEDPVAITGVPGSCACTTATISADHFVSGDTGVLTVTFDPNLHGEPDGRFFKSVVVLTDPVLETTSEVKIWVQIDLDLGPGAYKLQGMDDDDDDDHQG